MLLFLINNSFLISFSRQPGCPPKADPWLSVPGLPLVWHEALLLLKPSQATRLSAKGGPAAFRPIVTHGLAEEAARLSDHKIRQTRGFPSHSHLWFGIKGGNPAVRQRRIRGFPSHSYPFGFSVAVTLLPMSILWAQKIHMAFILELSKNSVDTPCPYSNPIDELRKNIKE
jgi:hypothetical protein